MDSKELQQKWKTVTKEGVLEEEIIGQTIETTYKLNDLKANQIEDIPEVKTVTSGSFRNFPQSQEDQSIEKERYQLIESIAQGGMGVIYRGEQVSLERSVAIKKMLSSLASSTAQLRFVTESKMTAFLDHPNIVPVYDLGKTEEGDVILVMKLIGGKSWKDLLEESFAKSAKPFLEKEEQERHLRLLLHVSNAIIYAHSKNIVHNDLKPENIMIGEFGEVYVMDWGIAVSIDEKQKNQAFVHCSFIEGPMGTPCYMPPELAGGEGEDIGPWTDVYLLGAILYEILMQSPPNQGNSILQILSWLCSEEPLEFLPEIPQELQRICCKALEKEPKNRYQTVQEFKKDLEYFLKHQESILITKEAEELLTKCQETTLERLSSLERNELYDQFAQSIASFHQALKLWQENKAALQGEVSARFGYARAAIKNEDFGLAQAQLGKLEANLEEAKKVEEELAIAKEMQVRSLISQRLELMTKAILIFVTIIVCDIATESMRSIKVMSFYRHPSHPYLFGSAFLFSLTLFFLLQKRKYSTSILKGIILFFQVFMVFITSLLFFVLTIPKGTLLNGFAFSGVVLVFFPLVIPYTRKMVILGCLFSFIVIFVALFLTQLFIGNHLPYSIVIDYVFQHFVAVISAILLVFTRKEQDRFLN